MLLSCVMMLVTRHLVLRKLCGKFWKDFRFCNPTANWVMGSKSNYWLRCFSFRKSQKRSPILESGKSSKLSITTRWSCHSVSTNHQRKYQSPVAINNSSCAYQTFLKPAADLMHSESRRRIWLKFGNTRKRTWIQLHRYSGARCYKVVTIFSKNGRRWNKYEIGRW